MGRGKSFKTDKEYTREQELSYKNKELQKEIARLRKSLDKLKFGWCPKCLGLEGEENHAPIEPPKIKERTCYSCGKANLIMIRYHKPDGTWYYRSCPLCGHRTRSKRYTEDVKE
jgi:hypothetical protein